MHYTTETFCKFMKRKNLKQNTSPYVQLLQVAECENLCVF